MFYYTSDFLQCGPEAGLNANSAICWQVKKLQRSGPCDAFRSSSPGWDMLRSSCRKVSLDSVLISSMSRRWPSGVRCQKQDFLFPSLHI